MPGKAFIIISLFLSGCATSPEAYKAWVAVETARYASLKEQVYPELDFQPTTTVSKTTESPNLNDEFGETVEKVTETKSEVDSEALAVHWLGKIAFEAVKNSGRKPQPVRTLPPEPTAVKLLKASGQVVSSVENVIGWGVGGSLIKSIVGSPNHVNVVNDSYRDESSVQNTNISGGEE